MTTFLLILCIALVCFCGLEFFYFDTKLRELRRQYRLLNQQFTAVKGKLSPSGATLKNLKIKYVPQSFSSGITKENIFVYFTPIDKTKSVCKLVEASDVPILQECVIANEIWLYVELDSINNVNSRGWILKKDFSFLKDKIQII
ncbi:hypothetical protein [uncultured Clostridium sp.]|jgi:hypothetical protein|uniref:hypothetical protein n=1 Tax=uncultured Clostridium sp. TaxID=59620 RepID=UPI0026204B18|nr:hypothetical protein [uncultured Clostridium sp.]